MAKHKHKFTITSEPGESLIDVRCECGTGHVTAPSNLHGEFSSLTHELFANQYYCSGWIEYTTLE